MSLGILFAFFAAFLWTAYNVLARKLAVKSPDPLAASCIYPLCAGLIASFIFIAQPHEPFVLNSTVIIVTILAMLCYSVFDILQFFTYKHLEISYRTIFTQVTPLVTFIASIFLLSEGVTAGKLLGILLIIGGNIFALYKHQSAGVSSTGVRLVLLTSTMLGLAYVGDKFASPHYPTWLYIAIAYYAPWISVMVVASILRGKNLPNLIRQELKLSKWRIPLLATFGLSGYYFFIKALSTIDVSIVTPISYTATILTVLAGILILKERTGIPRKIFAAIIVFLGVVLLG